MSLAIDHIDRFVGPAAQDQRNICLGGAKSVGYVGLRHSSSELSDFGDFISGQKLIEEGDFSNINGVLLVQPIAGPFQIGSGVVGFDTIDVIDDWESFRVFDESHRDYPMHHEVLGFPVLPESGLVVTGTADARSQNLPVALLPAESSQANAIRAPDPAKAADFVGVSETFICDRAPFFWGHSKSSSLKTASYNMAVSAIQDGEITCR